MLCGWCWSPGRLTSFAGEEEVREPALQAYFGGQVGRQTLPPLIRKVGWRDRAKVVWFCKGSFYLPKTESASSTNVAGSTVSHLCADLGKTIWLHRECDHR